MAYELSHFLSFLEPVHSQQPLAREGKIISSASFEASTSIVDPSFSVYEIEIQGDSDLDSIPTSKLEVRKMTGNPPDTQKRKTLALCHAILHPSEICNSLPVRCYMSRDQSHYIQKNRCDHTLLHLARDKGYIPPSFHHQFCPKKEKSTCQALEYLCTAHHACCFTTS